MKETDILAWIEKTHAQIWWDRHTDRWVCQAIADGKVFQPSRGSLREAVEAAHAEWEQHATQQTQLL
jgi:hypothetical protein